MLCDDNTGLRIWPGQTHLQDDWQVSDAPHHRSLLREELLRSDPELWISCFILMKPAGCSRCVKPVPAEQTQQQSSCFSPLIYDTGASSRPSHTSPDKKEVSTRRNAFIAARLKSSWIVTRRYLRVLTAQPEHTYTLNTHTLQFETFSDQVKSGALVSEHTAAASWTRQLQNLWACSGGSSSQGQRGKVSSSLIQKIEVWSDGSLKKLQFEPFCFLDSIRTLSEHPSEPVQQGRSICRIKLGRPSRQFLLLLQNQVQSWAAGFILLLLKPTNERTKFIFPSNLKFSAEL